VARPRDDRQKDLLRPALEEMIDLGHPLVRLAREIDWGFLDWRFASVCTPGADQPGLPTRLVPGLFILKHLHNLSDEALAARSQGLCAACRFVLHAKALHGSPFDGHTLGPVVTELEALTGVETCRIHVDKGYRGHNHAQKFRVWISGQVRRVTAPIRREMRRRAAVEPVVGHIKAEHRMGRNYLKGRDGDRINAVLSAVGYNFGLLLRWLESLLHALIRMLLAAAAPVQNAQRMLLIRSSRTTM
jgi:IS5 family transposase